jgi:hypothetical protein
MTRDKTAIKTTPNREPIMAPMTTPGFGDEWWLVAAAPDVPWEEDRAEAAGASRVVVKDKADTTRIVVPSSTSVMVVDFAIVLVVGSDRTARLERRWDVHDWARNASGNVIVACSFVGHEGKWWASTILRSAAFVKKRWRLTAMHSERLPR